MAYWHKRLLQSDENERITKATTQTDPTGTLEVEESDMKQSLLHDSNYIKLKKKKSGLGLPLKGNDWKGERRNLPGANHDLFPHMSASST